MTTKNYIVNEIENIWFPKGHLNSEERDFLIDLILQAKPKQYLEIGFCTGRSTITALFAAKPEKMVSVELNLDCLGARQYAMNLLEKFPMLRIYEGDSKKIINPEFFQTNFTGKVDFVFVDGGHSYQDALSDLQNVFPHVEIGGYIVVDDYMSDGPEGCQIPEVDAAVHDFCKANFEKINLVRWRGLSGKGCAIIKKVE